MVAVALLAPILIATPTWAGLGSNTKSVEADRAHMAARMVRAPSVNYTNTVLTLPNGGVVREFVGADGIVFAVAWHGPSRPDLRQLLGDRFATFQADTAAPRARRTRRPLVTAGSDMVVRSGGRPGAFHGFAYLPQRIPAGFTARDLQ